MNKEYLSAFSDAFMNVMPMLGVPNLQQKGVRECGKKIDSYGVVCVVGVIGELSGNVIFSMHEDCAKRIASYMMGGMEVNDFDELTQSAISELSNMLAANSCTGLAERGLTVDISTPTLMHGVFTVSGSFEPVVCIEMQIDDFGFNIFISLEGKTL